jgi:hypothetical protein
MSPVWGAKVQERESYAGEVNGQETPMAPLRWWSDVTPATGSGFYVGMGTAQQRGPGGGS